MWLCTAMVVRTTRADDVRRSAAPVVIRRKSRGPRPRRSRATRRAPARRGQPEFSRQDDRLAIEEHVLGVEVVAAAGAVRVRSRHHRGHGLGGSAPGASRSNASASGGALAHRFGGGPAVGSRPENQGSIGVVAGRSRHGGGQAGWPRSLGRRAARRGELDPLVDPEGDGPPPDRSSSKSTSPPGRVMG
jgi:hypothetical protein